MDVRQLLYFTTIVEEGSISAAAKKLHLSQPPLSYQLKLLEEELGIQLVQRGPRSITLTEAGRTLYKRAQNILALTELTKKELLGMASGFRGTLHIGTVSSSGASLLDWRIPEFHRRFGQISFAVHEGNTFELLEMLESGMIELAVVRTPFHNEHVDCFYLHEEPMIAAGARNLFPADMRGRTIEKLTLDFLDGAPLILYRRFESLLLDAFQQSGIAPQIFCVADDARTAMMWAEAGLGIAVVPQSAYRIMPHHNIIFREIAEERLKTRIAAICKKGSYLSASAKSFLQVFQESEPASQNS